MNHKQTNPSKLFGNKRSAQEQAIHDRQLKSKLTWDEEMDRHEAHIHHLNRENGIGVKKNVQK